MSVDNLISSWKEVRTGLIEEAAQVPADRFSFRPTPETRSVAELLHHIIETQKMIVGETCRADANIMRQSFADHIKEYAADVKSITNKDGLLEALRSSMDLAEASIRSHADGLNNSMKRFDGKEMSKEDFLRFATAHEMYHRGQFTVYERLLSIKPALTTRFEKIFSQSASSASD